MSGSVIRRVRRAAAIGAALGLIASAFVGCSDDAASCAPVSGERESVPRLWVEVALDAIRRDFPAPTVHARNLWHLSAVMWDAHTVFSGDGAPYFDTSRSFGAGGSADDEAAAISHAAHRLLTARYEFAVGGEDSLADFDRLMVALCQDPAVDPEVGTPAAIGRAIADAAIEFGLADGSLELDGYVDVSYRPVNPPLRVSSDEIRMVDPNRWQPLQLAERVTQNNQSLGPGVQVFIGPNWGWVESFALPPPDDRGITLDPGPPPYLGSDTSNEFVAAAVEMLDYADRLGGDRGAELIDIGPGARGHDENPATGGPYAPNRVPLGDYGRAIAEFWADGPDSETPPGHWNTLAIGASDMILTSDLRWGGSGPALSRHEWDLRLFFTLNAGLHDAAVAVWGTKRAYDYVRPISIVRYLGTGNGGGLPVTPGLVEVVTDETAAAGARHEGLPVGVTAVRSWLGPVDDPETDVAGVGWRPAIAWLPYQRPTFVSPAFAAYVSGHSGFSRAAAELLTLATGSPYFPGGLFTHDVPVGSLLHEEGPTVEMQLQWATYRDAADEAGESRRYGGIHVAADDLAGRTLGAEVAELVWERAQGFILR